MLFKNAPEVIDDLWAERQHQKRQNKKTNKASRKDGEQEISELHFEHRRGQNKHLEGRGRRKHAGKHQGPEFVALKRLMDLQKALFRNALAQNLFPSPISDEVKRNAAQGRSKGCHGNVKQHPPAILVDVRCDNKIDWHADQGAIRKSDDEYTPDSEHFHESQDPRRVARQNVSDFFQAEYSVYVMP